MRFPLRRRHVAVASLLALLLTGAVAAPASARTPDEAVVASGDGWTVERAPAGFVVTLSLDTPLPVVNDAPTIVVDGTSIGAARTSDGGRTLTVVTADPRVADARDVQKGWASGSGPKAGEDADGSAERRSVPEPENETLTRQLAAREPTAPLADPSTPGPFSVREAEYDFGDRAIDLAGYRSMRGEMAGKLYLSSAEGPRPVVILEHGRHSTCGVSATGESSLGWPCADDEMVIRSYLGYEGTGRALASHGYDVVSISANAINATDAEFSLDEGAQARGRLVLDTLAMLDRLAAGDPVTFEDRPDQGEAVTRSFDEAVTRSTTRVDQPAPASGVTAADLVGRFDLSRVGLMGHSRGGEGVVTAAQLNAIAGERYGIRSVLPLAPTDFARRTLSDVTTAAVLPYCDGDVADQQGQRFIDDSRRAFDDDVLRSAVWVMGANHNFFNSVWTPGEYPAGGMDDWPAFDTTSSCTTTDPTRLTAAEQYQVGVSIMTGFFRVTLGDEQQYRPLVDGSVSPRTTATEFADIRVMATQPRSATDLVAGFAGDTGNLLVSGSGQIEPCDSAGVVASSPCSYKSDYQLPHWGQALLAPFVPTYPATHFHWEGPEGATEPSDALLRVVLPADERDVSDRAQLTLKAAPWDRVLQGTDFSITLVDGAGGSYTVAASALNPYAVNRMPGGFFLLDKTVLQQITLPLSDVSGVDLTNLREVRLAPLIGADGSASGGVTLSDLAFDSPSSGAAAAIARTAVNMAANRVDGRDEPWEAPVAAYLDRPSDVPVSAWINTLAAPGAEQSSAGLGATRVTFEPGQTCVTVPVYLYGEPHPDGETLSFVRTGVTTANAAVTGANDFAGLLVRSSDADPTDLPFGAPGDACEELAASRTPTALALSSDRPLPGETVRATATGFRAGEGVLVSLGTTEMASAIADADGSAVIDLAIPDDAVTGPVTVTARGAGSARVQTADAEIAAPLPTPTPTPSVSPTPPTPTAEPEVPTSNGGSALPRTGVDGALWLLVALAGGLLAAGAGAALRRRAGRTR